MAATQASDAIGTSPDRRKLVAVIYADMIGYSRLIGLDDAGTLERLRKLRKDLIDAAVDQHGGKIIQTGGDSLLIVFDSIDGAVRCAATVQRQVPLLDGDQPPDRAMRFRVGVNIGDAIADGTDLHGEAVNIAVRLQTECPPGAICVTRAVRDHMQGRIDLAFEALGPLNPKNIAQPVEAFVLRPDALMATPKSIERSLMLGTGDALPLPDKPSIAVLSFTNMGGDPEQEFFSDGIAEDIITELSRSRSLFVIARNSSFSYKGQAVDVRRIARELGVRYVLEGSVRRGGERMRVVAQLIDAETGNHVWAERYDRDVNEIFALQDEITTAIATAILPAVSDVEQQRALRKATEHLSAWETYQRGLWYMGKANSADNAWAQQLFQRAADIDPMFASTCAAMGMSHIIEGAVYAARPLQETLERADIWARRAVAIDPNDADGQAVLAWSMAGKGNFDDALGCVSLALQINPNSVWAYCAKGAALLFNGRPSEARAAMLAALRLSPRDPLNALPSYQIGVSYYFERDYLNALEVFKRTVSRHPEFPLTYRYLAATFGELRHLEEAQGALQQVKSISPASFDSYVSARPPWLRPSDYEHLLDGLRKAGWQG
jgi:adenylate cyclase